MASTLEQLKPAMASQPPTKLVAHGTQVQSLARIQATHHENLGIRPATHPAATQDDFAAGRASKESSSLKNHSPLPPPEPSGVTKHTNPPPKLSSSVANHTNPPPV